MRQFMITTPQRRTALAAMYVELMPCAAVTATVAMLWRRS
jgi:hypothetical protein